LEGDQSAYTDENRKMEGWPYRSKLAPAFYQRRGQKPGVHKGVLRGLNRLVYAKASSSRKVGKSLFLKERKSVTPSLVSHSWIRGGAKKGRGKDTEKKRLAPGGETGVPLKRKFPVGRVKKKSGYEAPWKGDELKKARPAAPERPRQGSKH